MSFIKTLGLAALAVMTAMAFVGIATASAEGEELLTVLCKQPELLCEPENQWPNPTTLYGYAEDTKLLTNVINLLCESSLISVTLLNTLALEVEGHILELDLLGCKTESGTKCEVTVPEAGSGTFHKIAALLAHVTSDGKTEVNVKCGFFINCTYGGSPELTAHSTEAGVATLVAEKAQLEEGKGFLCPEESFWDAQYTAVEEDEEGKLVPATGVYIES